MCPWPEIELLLVPGFGGHSERSNERGTSAAGKGVPLTNPSGIRRGGGALGGGRCVTPETATRQGGVS